MDVPTGYPPVYGEIPGPGGLARRDALRPLRRPAGAAGAGVDHGPVDADAQGDGRIYGRGAADDKGGLAIHLGTLKVFDGKPPAR